MQLAHTLPRLADGRTADDRDDASPNGGPAGGAAFASHTEALHRHRLIDLFRLEAPWLNRFFRRRLGSTNDAEDLTQETFLRFLRATPGVAVETPQAYLRTIATNLLRDRAEHSATRWAQIVVPLAEGLDCPDEGDPEQILAARQELGMYERLLHQLPQRTFEVFMRSRVDGFRYAEIAEQLGISSWTVKREMMKAIAHIDQARKSSR